MTVSKHEILTELYERKDSHMTPPINSDDVIALHQNKETEEEVEYKSILLNFNEYDPIKALAFVTANRKFCIEHMNTLVDINNCTALYLACKYNAIEVASFFINADADINQNNKYGCSPLYISSCKGNDLIVKLLIDKGANVNQTDSSGCTPLYVASFYGHTSVVELLISGYANINQYNDNDKKFTPLYVASFMQHESIVKILVRNRAKQNR